MKYLIASVAVALAALPAPGAAAERQLYAQAPEQTRSDSVAVAQ